MVPWACFITNCWMVTVYLKRQLRRWLLDLLLFTLWSFIFSPLMLQVLNVFATDGQRLYDGVSFLPMLLGGPVLIFGAMGISVFLLGPWTLLGFFITLLLFPLQVDSADMLISFILRSVEFQLNAFPIMIRTLRVFSKRRGLCLHEDPNSTSAISLH